MMEGRVDPRLLVRGLSGPLLGRSWIVVKDRPLVLGREVAPNPEFMAASIPDPRISLEHCRIEYSEGAFRVIDLNSRNGVLINGKRIPRGAIEELRDGDVLSLAELALEVKFPTKSESAHLHSKILPGSQTELLDKGSQFASSLVPDLLPFPLAMVIWKIRNAIGALDRANEILRSFETILRFQSLVALSEYLGQGSRDEQVGALLSSFCQRPFTLGRWLELYLALTRALAQDDRPIVEELASRPCREEEFRRWKCASGRLVELRNSLLHGEGIGAGSAEVVAPEMTALFGEVLSGLAFWIGYRFIAVEPGSWSDEERVFRYPCRLLLGCASPFETRVLKSSSPLPPRVPILFSRDCNRRLSLGPFQAILPAEDKQFHWFSLAECTAGRTVLVTYPASVRISLSSGEDLQKLLAGGGMPSKARSDFCGEFPIK